MAGVTRVEKAINPVMGAGTQEKGGWEGRGEVETHWSGEGGNEEEQLATTGNRRPTFALAKWPNLEVQIRESKSYQSI